LFCCWTSSLGWETSWKAWEVSGVVIGVGVAIGVIVEVDIWPKKGWVGWIVQGWACDQVRFWRGREFVWMEFWMGSTNVGEIVGDGEDVRLPWKQVKVKWNF